MANIVLGKERKLFDRDQFTSFGITNYGDPQRQAAAIEVWRQGATIQVRYPPHAVRVVGGLQPEGEVDSTGRLMVAVAPSERATLRLSPEYRLILHPRKRYVRIENF